MAEKRPDRALGGNHTIFWQWCDKRELRLQHCADCGRISWPVVNACEYCGSVALDWQRMSGRGKIVSWCTFERAYYGDLLPTPWGTILVELEEGPLFISNPQDFTWHDTTAGMPVVLAFLECEDAGGRFQLPVFEKP